MSGNESEEITFARPDWLGDFEKRTGRSLRVLHIGNIANNAYSNAKIMREIGVHADVICADYYHMMGTPEWEEAEIKGDFGDPFFPDWWRVTRGYDRPEWFFQGPKRLCQLALRSQFESSIDEADARHNMTLATHYISYRDSATAAKLGIWSRLRRQLDFGRFLFSVFRKSPQRIVQSLVELFPALPVFGNALKAIGLVLMLPFIFLLTLGERLINFISVGPDRFGWKFTFLFLRLKWKLQSVFWQKVIKPTVPAASRTFKWITGKNFSEVTGRSAAEIFAGAPRPVRLETVQQHAGSHVDYSEIVDEVEQQRRLAEARKYFLDLENYEKWSKAHRAWHRKVSEQDLALDAQLGIALTQGWQDVFRHYDIIQAYSTDGIIPMALGCRNFFCFEHGTLRSIPFENNQIGRLTATAYRAGRGMIVTNLDTMDKLPKLKIPLEQAIFLPAPLDDRRYHVFWEKHEGLRPKKGAPIRFFSAARQHWLDTDPNYAKGNDIFLRAFAEVVTPEHDVTIKLVEWGRDVEETKKLVIELGIDKRIIWVPPMKIDALWQEYLKSHAIFDQFIIPAFGRVTFDALLFGRRVISNLDKVKAKKFFSVSPPMMVADDIKSAKAAIVKVLNDPDDENGIGDASRKWAMEYHSSQRMLDLQMAAYRPVVFETSTFTTEA